MTTRKPDGVTWETWVDRQVLEAQEQGAFEQLPGKGKPIPGAGEPYDPNWWAKGLMRREGLSTEHKTLEMRKKAEMFLESYLSLHSEKMVKNQAEALNQEIRRANQGDLGPLMPQPLLNTRELCKNWRTQR